MTAIKIILAILLAILIAVLAAKNMVTVEVNFYDFNLDTHSIQVPLLMVVLCSVAFGFLIAWVSGIFKSLKLRSAIRRKDKAIDSLNSEIEKLKVPSLPESTGDND